MYRLLLLDDEEIVIKGIQKVYDMPKYGFAVAGAFTSPLKAAEQLDSLKPDLVITDVKMPRMDGLEFASLVKKWNPETEVVILSGYDDFSYAQAAVKLGISDYLLKPIKKADFVAMLERMAAKIGEKQSRASQQKQMQELLQNSYTELKNRYFLALTEENKCEEGLREALRKHGQSEFEDELFLMVKIDTDQISPAVDYMSEIGKLNQEMENLLLEYGKVLDFLSDESMFFVLYDLRKEQYADVKESVRLLLERKHAAGLDLALGISDIHRGQKELFEARNDCVRQIFMQEANIADTSDANPVHSREMNLTIPYTEIEGLFHAILTADREAVCNTLDQIYVEPEGNVHVLYRDYVSSITFLILLRTYQLQNKYDVVHQIARQELLNLRYLRREYPGMEDQKQLVREICLALADLVSRQKVAAPSKMVQAALEYIDDHFRENISLQDVADNISISKNYLCDIFKKEVGVTFINYVTNLRIEKAKDYLANTDLKMYEVSSAVGYNDYTYFAQIFKKHTGTTLSAYRKNA